MKPTLIFGVYSLILYIIIAWQYKKINKSIFLNPLMIQILTFTISFFTIIHLYIQNYIKDETFTILFIEFIIYLITFMLLPHLISKKHLDFDNFINIKKFDIQLNSIIFYINLFLSLSYILLFWTIYSEGSDRVYFNKDFRVLSLLCTLFSIWSISLSSLIYSKTKIKKHIFFSITTIVLLSLMGSKGLSLVGIFIFLFFYLQFNIIKMRYLLIVFLIIFFSVVLPTQIMYGNALEIILDRILMSGDIYLFSFVTGDYKELIGYYDPISYLLHPYSSLFGIRGYDFPLGAQILSTANIPVSGVGPQDHMTILSLVFFPACDFCKILFTLFICLIIIFFMRMNFFILSRTHIHISLRVIIFMLIYTQIINIFVGINAFSFNIILIILSVILYFIALFFRYVSIKRKKNEK